MRVEVKGRSEMTTITCHSCAVELPPEKVELYGPSDAPLCWWCVQLSVEEWPAKNGAKVPHPATDR